MKKQKVIIALVLALLALLVSYISTNLSVSISGEKEVLKYWNAISSIFSKKARNVVPDDVVFINVSSDRQLVDISDEFGIPIGNAPITDRQKLYDLLSLLQSDGSYAYVMLDVFFEDGYATEEDSLLFNLISSMERIVIPQHADGVLLNPLLKEKAAYSDYSTNLREDNFVKYPLLDRTGTYPSMPLKAYTELTGRTVRKHGFLYTDKSSLSRRVVFPKMTIVIDSPVGPKGEKTYLNLGTDILDNRDDIDWENRTLVIGSFTGDDIHQTYAGLIPGCVINYNVLASLLRGQHKIPFGLILVYFLIFFTMSILLLNGKTGGEQSWAWLWAKLFVLYSIVLTIVCIVVFMIWGQAHDVFITSTLFSIIDTCKRWVTNKKKKNA